MQLYLHLGVHRAASTYFLHEVRFHIDAMQEKKLEVISPRDLRKIKGLLSFPSEGASLRKPLSLWVFARRWGKKPTPNPRHLAAFHRLLEERVSGDHGIGLISEENLIGTMKSNLLSHSLYENARTRLHYFAQMLPRPPARIGLAVRSYDRYWSSCFHYTKHDEVLKDPKKSASAVARDPRGWVDLVFDIQDAFPQAIISVWCQETIDKRLGDILKGFLDLELQRKRPKIGRINALGDKSDADFFSKDDEDHLIAKYQADLVRLAEMPKVHFYA